MKISKIKISGMKNPVGFALDGLRCAWTVTDTEAKQAADVKIDVAADIDFQNILYTKEGANLNAACEPLEMPLKPRTRYHVRVQVTGDNKETAQGTACFETGKIDEPWQGQWIKPQPEDKFHPVFEKAFAAKENLTAARLYISGLGLYAAKLNGKKVSAEVLTPYTSDYQSPSRTLV